MSGPMTRNQRQLPDIFSLRRLLQSVAMLDAIICPMWERRYYSFNANWAPGEMVGSMRNGQGDDFFAAFNCHGAFIKGFDHEAAALRQVPSEQFYRNLPQQLAGFGREPAFSPELVTFCMWCRSGERGWSSANIALPESGASPDSAHFLEILHGLPETYLRWAAEYYECEVSPQAVVAVYEHRALTERIVASLNPKCSLASLRDDVAEIGYPA